MATIIDLTASSPAVPERKGDASVGSNAVPLLPSLPLQFSKMFEIRSANDPTQTQRTGRALTISKAIRQIKHGRLLDLLDALVDEHRELEDWLAADLLVASDLVKEGVSDDDRSYHSDEAGVGSEEEDEEEASEEEDERAFEEDERAFEENSEQDTEEELATKAVNQHHSSDIDESDGEAGRTAKRRRIILDGGKPANGKSANNKPVFQSRYLTCGKCEEEYDVCENDKWACRWHPGKFHLWMHRIIDLTTAR